MKVNINLIPANVDFLETESYPILGLGLVSLANVRERFSDDLSYLTGFSEGLMEASDDFAISDIVKKSEGFYVMRYAVSNEENEADNDLVSWVDSE